MVVGDIDYIKSDLCQIVANILGAVKSGVVGKCISVAAHKGFLIDKCDVGALNRVLHTVIYGGKIVLASTVYGTGCGIPYVAVVYDIVTGTYKGNYLFLLGRSTVFRQFHNRAVRLRYILRKGTFRIAEEGSVYRFRGGIDSRPKSGARWEKHNKYGRHQRTYISFVYHNASA